MNFSISVIKSLLSIDTENCSQNVCQFLMLPLNFGISNFGNFTFELKEVELAGVDGSDGVDVALSDRFRL